MFLDRHEPREKSPSPRQLKSDVIKALGYLTSIASVLFLGAVAWTKERIHRMVLSGADHRHGDFDHRHGLPLRRPPPPRKREIEKAKTEARGTLASGGRRCLRCRSGSSSAAAIDCAGNLFELHRVAEGKVVAHVHHLELEPARLPHIAVP